MATPNRATPVTPQPYTVLRAICVGGERVEVGGTVELTLTQYTELAAAGKVGPHEPKAEGRAKAEGKRARADADAKAKAEEEAAALKKAEENIATQTGAAPGADLLGDATPGEAA